MSGTTLLTPNQKRAVEHKEGAMLVLAGAGSGKTMVITNRIAHLIQEGVSPDNILALTFTNKAAGEMKARVRAMIDQDVWIGTFHAFGLSILRVHYEQVGLPPQFIIYDEAEQKKVLKEALTRADMAQEKKDSPILHQISLLKDAMITPEVCEDQAENIRERQLASIYKHYQDILRESGAVDFADLVMLAVKVLQNNQIQQEYTQLYQYILVDEYQDTNAAQSRLINNIVSQPPNLFVVGDPDQSIYSWRGAQIANILSFEDEYENVQIVTLNENYRSTKHILEGANNVIANNQMRYKKDLISLKGEGETIKLYCAIDPDDEAHFICDRIKEFHNHGVNVGNMCILYRVNALSRSFEKVLSKAQIPYRVIGTARFYQRKEVKDILAFLRVIMNPEDVLAFERISQVPRCGLGKSSWLKFIEFTQSEYQGNIIQALLNIYHLSSLQKKAQKRCLEMGELLDAAQKKPSGEFPKTVQQLVHQWGYYEFLKKSDDQDFETRKENIDELFDDMIEYIKDDKAKTGMEYLQAISLMTVSEKEDGDDSFVSLMSIHAAKGMEYDICFIAGFEEEIFPSARSNNNTNQMEEERRLCYVALTRAREYLFITYAQRRFHHGVWKDSQVSRFLKEIEPQHREEYYSSLNKNKRSIPIQKQPPRESSANTTFEIGGKILHIRWGKGTILTLSGTGDKAIGDIFFQNIRQRKKVLLNHPSIRKIPQ